MEQKRKRAEGERKKESTNRREDEPAETGETEEAEKAEEVAEEILDLTLSKYKGFVVYPWGETPPGLPLCALFGEDDMFPIRAKPLEKKAKLKDLQLFVNGNIDSGHVVPPALKALKIKRIFVGDESMCDGSEYNCDGTALVRSLVCGPVVFVKY